MKRDLARLLAVSFLALFYELVLIRWLPANITSIAYFSNLVLISCFFGLGLGCLIPRDRLNLAPWFPLVLVGFVGAVIMFRNLGVTIPNDAGEWIWSQYGGNRFADPVFRIGIAPTLITVYLGNVLPVRTPRAGAGAMGRFPPLAAYTISVAGSIAGILVFSLFSFSPDDRPPGGVVPPRRSRQRSGLRGWKEVPAASGGVLQPHGGPGLLEFTGGGLVAVLRHQDGGSGRRQVLQDLRQRLPAPDRRRSGSRPGNPGEVLHPVRNEGAGTPPHSRRRLGQRRGRGSEERREGHRLRRDRPRNPPTRAGAPSPAPLRLSARPDVHRRRALIPQEGNEEIRHDHPRHARLACPALGDVEHPVGQLRLHAGVLGGREEPPRGPRPGRADVLGARSLARRQTRGHDVRHLRRPVLRDEVRGPSTIQPDDRGRAGGCRTPREARGAIRLARQGQRPAGRRRDPPRRLAVSFIFLRDAESPPTIWRSSVFWHCSRSRRSSSPSRRGAAGSARPPSSSEPASSSSRPPASPPSRSSSAPPGWSTPPCSWRSSA